MTFDELALLDAKESFMEGLPYRIKYYAPYIPGIEYEADDDGALDGYLVCGYVNTDFSDLDEHGVFTAYYDSATPVEMVFVTTDYDADVPRRSRYSWRGTNSNNPAFDRFLEGNIQDCYVFRKFEADNDNVINECEGCNTYMLVDEENNPYYDGEIDGHICQRCHDAGKICCCDDCGKYYWEDNIHWHERLDKYLCEDCEEDDDYYCCHDCNRLCSCEYDSFYVSDRGYDVCETCKNDYETCAVCHELLSEDTEMHYVYINAHGNYRWICADCCDDAAVYSERHDMWLDLNFDGGAIQVIDENGYDWEYDRDYLHRKFVITADHKLVHYTQAVWAYEAEEYILRSDAEELLDEDDYEDAEPGTDDEEIEHLFDWTKINRPQYVIGHWETTAERLARVEREEQRRQEEARRPRIYGYHSYAHHWVKHYTPADMFRYREQIAQGLSESDAANKLLYIGWELEIDGAGENAEKALAITTALGYPCNESDEFKCSHDGSLSNGFEIISMPCTLSHHTKVYKLKEGLAKARALGYVSHDAPPGHSHGTCGLHFHVNRNFFWDEHGSCNTISYDGNAIPDYKLKLTLLVHNNKEWLLPFSRRGEMRYCNFAIDGNIGNNKLYANDFTRDVDEDDGAIDRSSRGLKALFYMANSYDGHGSALNFGNSNTVEFRFCRGTLNYTTFVASLQYVQMTCEIVKSFDMKQLCSVDLDFYMKLAEKRGYNEFIKYMNKRMARVEVSVDSVAA